MKLHGFAIFIISLRSCIPISWMLLQENPKEHITVVVFHGIGGSSFEPCNRFSNLIFLSPDLGNNKLSFIEDLYRRVNVNVLAMAYRGYSYSEGSPNEIGIKEDVKVSELL